MNIMLDTMEAASYANKSSDFFVPTQIYFRSLEGDVENVTLFDYNVTEKVDLELAMRLKTLEYHLSLTRLVVQRILVPVIVLFGVAGNAMEIVVLTRRWMRSSTNFYLTALAIFDILYLLFSFIMSMHHWRSVRSADWYIHFRLPYGKPLIDICSNSAVWLTVTFTVERYIAVCNPMKGKVWCTPERARYVIIAVCTIAAIITFPEFFEFKTAHETKHNVTTLGVQQTEFSHWPSYKWGFIYTNQALFTFLPLLLLMAFNTLLLRAVMRASHQRQHMTKTVQHSVKQEKQMNEQNRITIMLISVVMIFLLCQLPQAILNLYVTYLQVTEKLTAERMYVIRILGNVFNMLVMFNATVNFILYSAFSTKFRQTYHRLFCKCLLKKSNQEELISGVFTYAKRPSRANVLVHASSTTTNLEVNFNDHNRTPVKKNGYSPVSNGSNNGRGKRDTSFV